MSFQGPTALTRSPSILTRSPSKIPLLNLPSRDDDDKIIGNVTHQNNGKIYKIPFLVFPKTSFDACNYSRDPKNIQNDDDGSENIPMTPYIDDPYIPDYVNIPPNIPQSLPQNIPQNTPQNVPQNVIPVPQNSPQNVSQNVPQTIPKVFGIDEKDESVVEFYSGLKNFWRTGTVVEFKLIDHKDFNVIELVLKITAKAVEAPRFYFSTQKLYSKFKIEDIKERMRVKKDMVLDIAIDSHTTVMTESDLKESVLRDLVVEFIETRLHVPPEGEN